MFTPGAKGFSGMLRTTATGNPHAIAKTITWNANIVDHHAVATNTAFALIQILIGLGIAWPRSLKVALGSSVVWSLGVWWFGEGLGGVLHGAGTPLAGGPGAVMIYALIALLLWPTLRSTEGEIDMPLSVAERTIGPKAARIVWGLFWLLMAILCLDGSGRAPTGVHTLITTVNAGQPGWLSGIDRHAASLVAHHGLMVALVFSVAFIAIGVSIVLPVAARRIILGVAIALALVIWVVLENFGMILAGGATDPNSGPLLILLPLCYFPLTSNPHRGLSLSRESGAVPLTAEVH
jgi:hypothetical protein